MTAAFMVDSLLMWCAQVVLLVAVAAVACLWLPHARARLYVWQGVLAVSLLLPFIMPTRLPDPIEVTQTADDGLVSVSTTAIVKVPAREPFWRGAGVLWLLGGSRRRAWSGWGSASCGCAVCATAPNGWSIPPFLGTMLRAGTFPTWFLVR